MNLLASKEEEVANLEKELDEANAKLKENEESYEELDGQSTSLKSEMAGKFDRDEIVEMLDRLLFLNNMFNIYSAVEQLKQRLLYTSPIGNPLTVEEILKSHSAFVAL